MIKVENLMAGYDKLMIIRGVNIDVHKGEIVSIIGRNGVGKSTLMKTLIGLIPAKEGTVYFNGQDISRRKSHERARMGIGYVPQGHGIFPGLTVEENLKMGDLINKKETKQDFDLIFEYFPILKERRKQKAGTLSGGEQAMLSIGRALINKPDLLLLDEPSEGIQPNIIHHISNIIKRINEELVLTVLFVEQHIGLIQQMSNRCYAMDKGCIVGEINADVLADYETIKRYLAV